MPESTSIAELPKQNIEESTFNQAKIRIEKSKRIKNDLNPETGSSNKYRIDEIRNVEMRSKPGEEGKDSGFQEMVIDTRSYQEKRFKMTYINPTGQKMTEDLVMFVKIGKDGQPQWLSIDGQPLTLNADLYDSRLESKKHTQDGNHKTTVIPRVDGRGAYTGIVSIIEQEKNNVMYEESTKRPGTTSPELESHRSEEEFYKAIGQKLKFNHQNPPKPEAIIPPLVGNVFGENDTPTLAGKVAAKIYNELITRSDYKSPYTAIELVEICKEVQQQYTDYVKQQLLKRWINGDKSLTFGIEHKAGSDGFHFQGDARSTKDHAFYFSKSHVNWRDPHAQEIRAYITLDPQDLKNIQKHFVDLSLQLYDAGIDFSAKASSPAGMVKRTDNIVLYISADDQPRAAGLIKEYLSEKGLGQGHVDAALPSPQEGLSWALEPNKKQTKIWQETSGSSQKTSFNMYVATRALPTYLERLALAHLRKGDKESADAYSQEVKRVNKIISEHQSN